ncbi:MAG: TIR domain-containing protein, partial [Verrucomicrobia bacterium]|nr:TIR domain-containing protein [Verrucomicrobiota bacterium]
MTTALKRAQELESDIHSRYDAGTVPNIDVLQARQYRLDNEIELAKLKRDDPPESITRQRLSEATEMLRLAEERFAEGTGTMLDLISAHQQLTKVELDACRTSDERTAVMTTALKRAQELESDIHSRYDAGTVPNIDVLQAHQYRLDTEIELGKLKSMNSLQPLWKNIRAFLHWDAFPKDYKELLDACVVNGAAAGLIYFLLMLCLYGIAPSKFAAWHEWIANAGIPFSEKIAKTLAPFLLDTSHTLNAVVLRYQARARRLFDDTQEVKYRLKWVPAPLLVDDELLYDYNRPQTLPSQKPYVAGLLELQARLGVRSEHFASRRSIVSIEGPGGVGKSALAFQIARWASDSRADYRLARFPVLPVLLKSLGSDPKKLNNVDEAAADSVRLIMETSKISAPLLQALLRRKRVLVVVDGVSEMPKEAADLPIHPDKGAVNARFLVVTSRLPTNLLESHVIRPQGLTIEALDRVLDDLIAANVGSRRFNDTHRETLRMRIRSLIKDAGEGAEERGVPMIFIKLMIERADQLLNEGKQFAELPTTLAESVTKYTEQLLRNEQDLAFAVQQSRTAAHVCMGKERSPAARSENRYTRQGVSKEVLDKFVTAGLMVGSGDKSDPFYKFALDPIAEQLDANRLMIDIREERAEPAEIDDLIRRWEVIPEDFILALRRAAAIYGQSIFANQSALSLKLWPQEIKANGQTAIEPPPQSGNFAPAVPSPSSRAVFISYAHADNESLNPKERWLNRFVDFLKPLVRQEDFTLCSDQDIKIGEDWHQHIQAQINGAKAVVLLISPAFLASDYIANGELPVILKNAADQGVRIFPILISPSVFKRAKYKYPNPKTGPQEVTLASIQAANPPSETLIEMTEGAQNRVLEKVANQLADLLSANPQ